MIQGNSVQVKEYITLKIIFREEETAKEVRVRYLVIDAPSSYNMIILRPYFNQLGPPFPPIVYVWNTPS